MYFFAGKMVCILLGLSCYNFFGVDISRLFGLSLDLAVLAASTTSPQRSNKTNPHIIEPQQCFGELKKANFKIIF